MAFDLFSVAYYRRRFIFKAFSANSLQDTCVPLVSIKPFVCSHSFLPREESKNIICLCCSSLYIWHYFWRNIQVVTRGGVPCYESIFLTTRNGIFFGLPLLCVGELTWKTEKKSLPLLLVSGIALIAEIAFVGAHAEKMDDRSMYLMLPLFIFALVLLFRDWNPKIDGKYLGGISSAIYVMQYGIITVGTLVFRKLNLTATNVMWLVYIAVVLIPVVFYLLLRDKRIVKIIF